MPRIKKTPMASQALIMVFVTAIGPMWVMTSGASVGM
jgi:hypothetical protein